MKLDSSVSAVVTGGAAKCWAWSACDVVGGACAMALPVGTTSVGSRIDVRHRVASPPGATVTADMWLPERAFAVWDGGWTVDPGDYDLLVGRSAGDLPLTARIRVI